VLARFKQSTTLPIGAVGAKIRLGMNQLERDHRVYLPVVELANDHLDYLVVHGRHAKQRSREPAAWGAIGEVKAKATIPVIGNGDVTSRETMEKMRQVTGCDGVMVARAAIENPWIFRALSGRAADASFTIDDVARAAATYTALAAQHGTKDKFQAFHADAWARLRAVAEGRAPPKPLVPKNLHMDA
jgi:tRNA-dihydrouridine synthase